MKKRPSKINYKKRDQWKNILEEVEKDEIPVEVMERVTVNLIGGEHVNIYIREMLSDGTDPHVLQKALQEKLDKLDQYIEDIDFHINLDAVAGIVEPLSEKILKNL